eukprot:1493968-Rhodomonas_salina.3
MCRAICIIQWTTTALHMTERFTWVVAQRTLGICPHFVSGLDVSGWIAQRPSLEKGASSRVR